MVDIFLNNYFVQSSVRKIFFIVVPVLTPCLPLSTSRRNFPFEFLFNCTEEAVEYYETGFNFEMIDKFLICLEVSTIRV